MIVTEHGELIHYGTPRHSGRYPWGSGGDDPDGSPRSATLFDYIREMKSKGLSDVEIARGIGVTTTQLRAMKSIEKNAKKQADISMAQRLKEKGLSNVAIGERMGINESQVRSLLAPGQQEKLEVLNSTANMLKAKVAEKKFVDIGAGVEMHIGLSRNKLDTAVAVLKEEGYEVHKVQVDQLGTSGKTTIKVLAAPGTTYRDIVMNKGDIQQIATVTYDGGRTHLGLKPPLSVNPKRVAVRYAEQGGADADGVIYVRPGVDDVSLGGSRYAQVRITVDGTHYLKGMAMYKDDLPPGVDLMFNTNKSDTGNKLDAMKPLKVNKETGKIDEDNPYGSAISHQILDPKNGKVTSAMNIVNEEGDWSKWSRTISSQMLSKQKPSLAKTQLDMTFENKKGELDEILSLTNPAVRKKLLEAYADGADAAAVHLKAAGLPNTANHVILPITSTKEHEIYAPNYNDGDRVVLIRHPHGGIFEIPELVVNNKNPEAKKVLGRAPDAVGIHPKVAERLSGADFDGDTVLVIPNNKGLVNTAPALAKLKGFDPKSAYPKYEGMPKMSPRTKAVQMGEVSNLITDMTIKGAPFSEIAQAVRHSMVVIDAEKHDLNYKQSAIDNGIAGLKQKYQRNEGENNRGLGASTLISRAKSEVRVPDRKPRAQSEGGPVDRKTGEKVFTPTDSGYIDAKGKFIPDTIKSTKLTEAKDARTLSSGTPIEKVYAEHSNKLKALANKARLEAVNTEGTPYSVSAKTAHANEVASLNSKLVVAQKNAPLERQAQVLAGTVYQAKLRADPGMEPSEKKKIKSQALTEARLRTGAGKERIVITDQEWAAIQAGAFRPSKLKQILDNADLDVVKQHATPKQKVLMTSSKTRRAQTMLASGYTQAEVAAALGVSVTTLKNSLV